ncbi:MAG: DUF2723 domain-containing protein [Candidatus Latescibacteria bacterium]|nr:DUF2723 domain-containing protein [bacterium]MBD3423670.1 DUF2723 domain-containing protein [Candidatus Latescibacterota bacterium]
MNNRNHNFGLKIPSLLFIGALLILIIFTSRTPPFGDSYVYAHRITTLELTAIHCGYCILGAGFHFLLRPFGTDPVLSLNILSILLGSLSVVCMYLFSYQLTGDPILSIVASMLLLFNGTFWMYAEYAEVYVPQLFFVLLSILAIVRLKPAAAALCFMAAITITPSSVLVLPAAIYLIFLKKYNRRQILSFLLPVTAFILFLCLLDLPRAFRLMKWPIRSPVTFFDYFSYFALFREIISRVAMVYGKSFNIMLLAAAAGFVLFFKGARRIWYLMLALILPFGVYILNIGLFSGDHMIISLIAVAFCASYGLVRIIRRLSYGKKTGYAAALSLIAVYALISHHLLIGHAAERSKELEKVVEKVSVTMKKDGVLISDFNVGTAIWYLEGEEINQYLLTGRPQLYLRKWDGGYEDPMKGLQGKFWINRVFFPDSVMNIKGFAELLEGRTIYVAGDIYRMPKLQALILPGKVIERKKKDYPGVKEVGEYFERRYNASVIYYPIVEYRYYYLYRLLIRESGTRTPCSGEKP